MAPASLKPCPSASVGGPPQPLPEMGTASSVPPGNQAPPTPSGPLGLRAAPASPAPPRPAAVLEFPAPGEILERPSGVTVPRFRTHPALWVAVQHPPPPAPPRLLPSYPPHHPSALGALPCPAPTAARKDAAWVPCQSCECAAPPSRARNAAGPRGRPQTPGSGQAQCAQAGRWPRLARTWRASTWKASCLALKVLLSLH